MKKKLVLPDKYVLLVEGMDFRKNIGTLMRAFRLALKDRRASEYKLVIAGYAPSLNNKFYPRLDTMRREGGIDAPVLFLPSRGGGGGAGVPFDPQDTELLARL